MWFGLLGPLQVIADGRKVVVSAAKQRVLLAALLLSPGQLLSGARLAELVWDRAPPPGSAVTLRSYVMRLRQALGPAAGSRIVTASAGYLIEVTADELDVACFTALCRTGEAAGRAGAWHQASDALARARSLWRGNPLADVPSETLKAAEVPRLRQLHFQAIQWRIEADLHQGRSGDVVPELRALTAEHPLQEPFHAQLMLALYHTGRQADALAAYRDARHQLVRQLGIEPGPQLQQLQRRILARDPDLAAVSAGDVPVVPRQLPPPVRCFAGRAAELATLTSLLGNPPQAGDAPVMTALADGAGKAAGPQPTLVISAIAGTAGVGKTALAVQWAHQVAAQFPDGQLYANLHGHDPGQPTAASEVQAGFMRALGVAGRDIRAEGDERTAQYRSLLATRRVLVLLDNARSAEQVRPLLPGTPGCAVLVTSRDALAGLVARDGAKRLELDLLTVDEAVALLRMLIGERADADPAATRALTIQCARLPLALRVAAELIASRPAALMSELAGELADQQRRLDLLDASGDSDTAVRSVFSWSYRHLNSDSARAFRLLGLHPGADFDRYAAAALAGVAIQQASHLLNRLARAHLIQPTRSGRFSMHDLLRAYAAELALRHDGEPGRQTALTRLFDHYLHTAARAMDTLFPAERHRRPAIRPAASAAPFAGPEAAQAWLDAQRDILVAVAGHTDPGLPGYADQLAAVLFRYLDDGGHFNQAAALYWHACRDARARGDHAAESAALTGLGTAGWRLGRYDSATRHLSQALALCQETGDRAGEARALGTLGLVASQQGRYEQAASYYRQTLSLCRQIRSREGEASSVGNLGDIELRLGRYEDAARHHQQALELARQTGNRTCEAYALANIGAVELRLGRFEQSVSYLQQCLELSRRTGNRTCEAYALTVLGAVDLQLGRHQLAASDHQRALVIFRETGDLSGEAEALNGLGDVLLATGQASMALTEFATALRLATQIGNMYENARASNGLGRAYDAASDAARARLHWRHAVSLYTDLGTPEASQPGDQPASGLITPAAAARPGIGRTPRSAEGAAEAASVGQR